MNWKDPHHCPSWSSLELTGPFLSKCHQALRTKGGQEQNGVLKAQEPKRIHLKHQTHQTLQVPPLPRQTPSWEFLLPRCSLDGQALFLPMTQSDSARPSSPKGKSHKKERPYLGNQGSCPLPRHRLTCHSAVREGRSPGQNLSPQRWNDTARSPAGGGMERQSPGMWGRGFRLVSFPTPNTPMSQSFCVHPGCHSLGRKTHA